MSARPIGPEPFRRPARVVAATAALAAGLVLLVACGDSGSGSASATKTTTTTADRFDAQRAWKLIKQQLEYGQRPAGSPKLRRLAVELRDLLPEGRFEAIPGEPKLRNVVGTIPGSEPAIVIGAHYDTLRKPKGFVGANNGAAGTAIAVQLARELAREPRSPEDPELRFVLFDGEEPAKGLPEDYPDFYAVGLRGSKAYVAAHPEETEEMVLLDYVANKGLTLPREGSSTPELWEELRTAAGEVGAGSIFPDETAGTITDDHTPFLRAGVPAVDLIDWSYPGHSLEDGLDMLSKRSVDAVGETIAEYLNDQS